MLVEIAIADAGFEFSFEGKIRQSLKSMESDPIDCVTPLIVFEKDGKLYIVESKYDTSTLNT